MVSRSPLLTPTRRAPRAPAEVAATAPRSWQDLEVSKAEDISFGYMKGNCIFYFTGEQGKKKSDSKRQGIDSAGNETRKQITP